MKKISQHRVLMYIDIITSCLIMCSLMLLFPLSVNIKHHTFDNILYFNCNIAVQQLYPLKQSHKYRKYHKSIIMSATRKNLFHYKHQSEEDVNTSKIPDHHSTKSLESSSSNSDINSIIPSSVSNPGLSSLDSNAKDDIHKFQLEHLLSLVDIEINHHIRLDKMLQHVQQQVVPTLDNMITLGSVIYPGIEDNQAGIFAGLVKNIAPDDGSDAGPPDVEVQPIPSIYDNPIPQYVDNDYFTWNHGSDLLCYWFGDLDESIFEDERANYATELDERTCNLIGNSFFPRTKAEANSSFKNTNPLKVWSARRQWLRSYVHVMLKHYFNNNCTFSLPMFYTERCPLCLHKQGDDYEENVNHFHSGCENWPRSPFPKVPYSMCGGYFYGSFCPCTPEQLGNHHDKWEKSCESFDDDISHEYRKVAEENSDLGEEGVKQKLSEYLHKALNHRFHCSFVNSIEDLEEHTMDKLDTFNLKRTDIDLVLGFKRHCPLLPKMMHHLAYHGVRSGCVMHLLLYKVTKVMSQFLSCEYKKNTKTWAGCNSPFGSPVGFGRDLMEVSSKGEFFSLIFSHERLSI